MSWLELHNIHLQFANKRLLHAVNCSVEAGQMVVILGPNGAGKSSLLKVASGEINPTDGDVKVMSWPINQLTPLDKAQTMAVLPQHSRLEFTFSVREVVSLGRTPHRSGAVADRTMVSSAMEATDVTALSEQNYTRLSGGEKQRVQLARVLVQLWDKPGLLLLDEPTAGLDFSHQQLIMQALKATTRQGGSVLMVLHDVNLAASFADQVMVMQQGEIVACGEPKAVLREALLDKVFGLAFHRITHPLSGKTMFVN
jgi:iron complex transport system ATP-binding protein